MLASAGAFSGVSAVSSRSRASEPTAAVIVDGPGGDALAEQLTKDKLGGLAATTRKAKSVPCKLGAAKGAKGGGKAKTALDACLRKTVDADAIVLVVVTKGPKGRVVDIRVVPHQGNVTEARVTLPAKATASDVDKVKDPIEPALAPLAPKPETTSTSTAVATTTATSATTDATASHDDETPPEEEKKPPEKAADGGPHPNTPRIAVAVGPGFGARSFSFRNGTAGLRPYSLKGALLLGMTAEAFPGDDGEGVRFRPGVAFGYVTSSGLTSETDVGRDIGTTWTRLDIGLRGRLALGGARSPVFTLGIGFAREAFVLVEADLSIPAGVYWTWRASLDARVPLGPVAILATAAALPGIRMSGATDPFLKRSLLGLEGAVGAALPFARNFEIRLLIDHTRYSTKFVAAPGATSVATGSTDSFTRLQVMLAFLY